MADTVRIYWRFIDDGSTDPTWFAYVESNGKYPVLLFLSADPDEFFRRYNAITVTKEPAPQED